VKFALEAIRLAGARASAGGQYRPLRRRNYGGKCVLYVKIVPKSDPKAKGEWLKIESLSKTNYLWLELLSSLTSKIPDTHHATVVAISCDPPIVDHNEPTAADLRTML
jgi:hypothetical protein